MTTFPYPPCPPSSGSPMLPHPPALPASMPRYVIPGSHWSDPAYWQIPRPPTQFEDGWPFARAPWPGESPTRAPGTGLVTVMPPPAPPMPPPWWPCRPPPWGPHRCGCW